MKVSNNSITIDMSWSEFSTNLSNVPVILICVFPNSGVATDRCLENLFLSSLYYTVTLHSTLSLISIIVCAPERKRNVLNLKHKENFTRSNKNDFRSLSSHNLILPLKSRATSALDSVSTVWKFPVLFKILTAPILPSMMRLSKMSGPISSSGYHSLCLLNI